MCQINPDSMGHKTIFLFKKTFFILMLLTSNALCFALPSDREQKLHIIADTYLLNYKTGVDIYEGHVKMDQGSTHLIADKVVTEKNKERQIISTKAYGIKNLAEFSTLPKEGDHLFHAKAKIIIFYPNTSLVTLENEVKVTQGENSFEGPIIVYNMKDQIVTTPPSKRGRATIIIDTKPSKS